jgi:hypothetical protein
MVNEMASTSAVAAARTLVLPYPAWMSVAERRANDALRAAAAHYAALADYGVFFAEEEERRYCRLVRAAARARRFVEVRAA